MASVKQLPRRGLILMGFIVIFGAALTLLSQSRVMALSAGALIIAGGVATTYNSLNMSLLFENSPRQFHGRVLSLMSLDRGFVSLGAVLAGTLAETLGPQTGLLVLGLSCISVMVLLFFLLPALAKIN
jgi:MFS family permease